MHKYWKMLQRVTYKFEVAFLYTNEQVYREATYFKKVHYKLKDLKTPAIINQENPASFSKKNSRNLTRLIHISEFFQRFLQGRYMYRLRIIGNYRTYCVCQNIKL